jgi:hypothetical protein
VLMAHSGPIFVGGTGRSGTTVTSKILGSHSRIHMIPIEVRFIVDPGGLCDLVAGKASFEQFREKLWGGWWYRERHDGSTRGLRKIIDEESMQSALHELQESALTEPESARRFVHRLLDPLASASGASRWVEMTPPNVLRGTELVAIFPDMKLIHVARDGRNVACSVAPLTWGPTDHFSALEWWADRMIEAHRACQGLSRDQLLEIRMEDLTNTAPSAIERLFDFVEETPDRNALEFLRDRVSAERANVERWKTAIDPQNKTDFLRRYTELVTRLASAGLSTKEWRLP